MLISLPAIAADPPSVPVPTRVDNDANTRKGFDHFYNLEYDKSLREFEAAQQAHPDDPFAVNHTLAGVIFKELLRIGALETEAYAGDTFLDKAAVPPDPKVHEQVIALTDQSLALSQARLDKNPNDVDALYAQLRPAPCAPPTPASWRNNGLRPCAEPWPRGMTMSGFWNRPRSMSTPRWWWERTFI